MMWLTAKFSPFLSIKQIHASIPLFMVIAGVILILMSSVSFLRQKTTLNPMKPESSSVLIKTGLYQYSRNPIYLGLATILLGWGLYLNNIVALLCIAGFVYYMNRFQIEPEEETLGKIFGVQFDEYKGRVRRWF
ncbi:MAG: isoprenylcysteine carboxylmethyltransferase family protein [Nitrosomonas sp.]|nr:isoprenylcysteine carboxylmethyltransferase family protein [Nitrosomonas sp.]